MFPYVKRIFLAGVAAAFMLIVAASCTRRVFVHSYQETPTDGWEQNDTLMFRLDTVRRAGLYRLDVGLRTTTGYPYKTLWLLVETHLRNPREYIADTLVCNVTDDDGNVNGRGVSTYQYTYTLDSLRLRQGQTGQVCIRHIMRRSSLPGISGIGIEIRQNQ